MNYLARGLTASVILGSSAVAAPFLAIGDTAELFLTGSLGVRHDDNIFLSSTEVSDTIFDIAPGFDLTFGKNALTQGSLAYTETISRYSDNSRLNTELSSVTFTSKYDDAKLKLAFDASFKQLNQNTRDSSGGTNSAGLPVLSRRDEFKVSGKSEVSVSEKTSVAAGVSVDNYDYKRASNVDRNEFSVPLNVYYELTPKVDLSGAFRYRSTDLDKGIDSDDYFYGVGARGEFTPKIKGEFNVGLVNRSLDNGSDSNGLGLDAKFTYLYSDKTQITFGGSSDFSTDGTAASSEKKGVNAGVVSKISEEFSVNTNVSFTNYDYTGSSRSEDYITASIGGDYTVNRYLTVRGSYAYSKNDSNVAGGDFAGNIFTVTASVRY